ncbi:hypothetical protein ABPG75_005857 [Micractinium tetrahymenae]
MRHRGRPSLPCDAGIAAAAVPTCCVAVLEFKRNLQRTSRTRSGMHHWLPRAKAERTLQACPLIAVCGRRAGGGIFYPAYCQLPCMGGPDAHLQAIAASQEYGSVLGPCHASSAIRSRSPLPAGMHDPRHLLKEARELKLSERGEGSTPATPRRAAQPRPSVDLEAPLLEGSQVDGSSPKLSDGQGAAAAEVEEQVMEGWGAAHAHPGLHHRQLGRRDSRDLWRLARRQMDLSYREDPDAADNAAGGTGYVVRVRPGAHQPAPSWQRGQQGRQPGGAAAMADLFVEVLTGKGLGTGAALRTPASLLEPEAPG